MIIQLFFRYTICKNQKNILDTYLIRNNKRVKKKNIYKKRHVHCTLYRATFRLCTMYIESSNCFVTLDNDSVKSEKKGLNSSQNKDIGISKYTFCFS